MASLTQHELYFLGRMNIRYHESLERLYGEWLNWTSFVSLLLSSAAFATLGSALPPEWQSFKTIVVALLALAVTGLNGAVLAFGMRNKFITHVDLKRQWIDFLSRLQNADDTQIPDIERAFHALNAREPAPQRRRLSRAYEETCKSLSLKPVT